MMAKQRIEAGTVFGSWTAIRSAHGQRWTCACSCGTTRDVFVHALLSGRSSSCGCKKTVHGRTQGTKVSAEYNTWTAIKQRCHNPDSPSFAYYGARGIVVCEEWRGSFDSFRNHVGARPGAEYSLDRIDNARGYEPGNVRWATKSEQARNRRGRHMLTIDGRTMGIVEWCEVSGVPFGVVRQRYVRMGWSAHDAVFTPVGRKSQHPHARGDMSAERFARVARGT